MLLLAISLISVASPIAFDYSKLSSSLIKNMCQDGTGYLWIGTEYGLNRFDGHKFRQYLHTKDTTSLRANDIRYIYTDRKQRLWVGTTMGLQLYEPTTDNFRYVPLLGTPQGTAINWIVQLANGKLLVCTTGRGTYQLDEQTMTLRRITLIDETAKITRIFQDRRQRLWVATDKGELYVGKRKINTEAGNGKTINNICQDSRSRIIVATGGFPFVVDENTFALKPITTGNISNLDIRSLKATADGRVFMLCYNNGLQEITSSLDVMRCDILSTLGGKTKNEYTTLIEDRDKNLWVAQNQGGLILLPHRQPQLSFVSFTSGERPFGIATVRSVATDSRGHIVVGSLDSHLYFCESSSRISKDIVLRSPAYAILPFGSKLLVGTRNNGLATVDPTTGSVSYLPSTADERVSAITRGNKGNIFIAVYGKNLYHIDLSTGKTTALDIKQGDKYSMKNHHVCALITDSKGCLWAGHYKGVDIYDPQAKKFLNEPSLDTLNNLACNAIAEDKHRNIWIATSDGLYKWDRSKKTLDRYDTERGLTNNLICGVAIDKKGNIWCSTFNGINMIDASDGSIRNYYNTSATADKEFTRSAFFAANNGELLLFGGVRGLTYFRPSQMKQAKLDREVLVTGLSVGGKDVTSLYSGTLESATTINFDSDDTFTIDFSTLDFTTADATTYEFRILENGKQWTPLQSGSNSITFSNLSSGSYTLQVRASIGGNFTPIKTLTLRIAAPWYLSWYAFLLYAIVVAVIAYLIYNNVRHRQTIKENEIRTQLFYNVAHDIRSPMTLIASPLEELLRKDFDGNTQRLLRTMYRNAQRILNMMNEMLDIRRMDVGKTQLSLEYTDMKAFVSGTMEAFEGTAKNRQIDFSLDCKENIAAWIDRNQLDKVVVNLIDNAFKYTPDGGKISVAIVSSGEKRYEIAVADNGKGIDEGESQKLFDRFYQAEKGRANVGFGIGLHLCKMIVEKHRGTISARRASAQGGSVFSILLPVDGGEQHEETPAMVSDQAVMPQHPFLSSEPTDEERQRRRAIVPTKRNRILIVDDDEEIRDFLQAELADTYRIEVCNNGVEALKKTVEHLPDIVISDVIMPEMDGFTLLKRLKGNTSTSHIPVIMLTTKGELTDKLKGIETGADAYIAKPFVVSELVAMINNLISGRALLRGKFSGVQDQSDKTDKIEMKGNDELLMERIMKSVNKHIGDEDYGVEMLASEVGLSRVQLHRRMKEMTGMATSDFIRNIRIKQAAELLAQNKVNVSQIAYAVGFQNRSYFSSVFKNYYGMTPQQYAENHQGTSGETNSASE